MAELLALLSETSPRAVAGVLAAGVVAFGAFRVKSLSVSGAVAATVVGGSIVAGAGWWSGLVLVLYFVSSSGWSHYSAHQRSDSTQQRGKQRDAVQVAANGGVAAILALACLTASRDQIALVGMFAAIAAAAADTWATELGRLSNSSPRLITTGRRVERGTSGGVSGVGTLAAVAGSFAIGLLSLPVWMHSTGNTLNALHALLLVTVAGFVGAMLDSLLGATVQQQRWCGTCEESTERSVHTCGTVTSHASGVFWMNNDVVNATSIAVAAGLAMAVATWAM